MHNAIVWQDRRTADVCARLKAARQEPLFRARQTGLVLDPYFSGDQARLAARQHARAAARAERGELAFGTVDTWLIWKLTGGARARHRRHQRLAHPALQHPHGRLGRRAARAASHSARAAAARSCPRARSTAKARPSCSARRMPIAGIAGDQQAALFGQACFSAGHGQEHLRHRLLPAAATPAPRPVPSQTRPAHHRRVRPAAARSRSTRSRAASSSAARWCSGCATAWAHPLVGRRRSARRERAGHRRRLPRAGLRRPRRAALGRRTRAAPSSASRAAPRARTSRAPRSKPSPSRSATCCRRCRRTPASA